MPTAETTLPTADVYMANNSGPRTLPCGKSDVQLTGKDCSDLELMATYGIRSMKKDCSQLRAVPWTIKGEFLVLSVKWHLTVS